MEKFYERYWSHKNGEHLTDFRLKWPKLQKFIPRERGMVIADFGCGTGLILKEILKINPTTHLFGFDVSEIALGEARKNLPKAEFFKIEDGGQLPLADESVDFVFSSEVIEHVYDTENAIAEIARVMKRGAKLLLTTPYHGFIKNLAIVFFGFDKHFNPIGPHIRFFSKKTITKLLGNAGLKIVCYDYYGRFFPFSHSIIVLAEKPTVYS